MNPVESFDVVDVRGLDALAFLQGQFAADLNSVADGQLRWAALLNPQGRVLHLVGAWRTASDQWWLLVPCGRGDELVASLRGMVFRRKVKLERRADLHVVPDDGGVALGFGNLRVGLGADAADIAWTGTVRDAAVEAGLALIDQRAAGRHLAHALRLDRFDAFSVKKGCYPGQEIVARTHFLGRNKRALVRLSADDSVAWQSADRVWIGDTDSGEIASAGSGSALAVLTTLPAADDALRVGESRSIVMLAEGYSDTI